MATPDNQAGASDAAGASGASSMSTAARSATSTISDAAHQAARQTSEQASRAAGQAQQQAQAFLSEQKEVAAGHIESVAQVLHQTVDQLRERSPGAISDYAERAVGGIDSLASALRERDLRDLVGQVEDFARRQPVLFVAGTVAAGFALARFLKSSSRSDHGYGQAGGQYARSRDEGGAYAYPAESGGGYGQGSSLGQSAPAMGSSDGPATPQYSTTRSYESGARATPEEIRRAMSRESE